VAHMQPWQSNMEALLLWACPSFFLERTVKVLPREERKRHVLTQFFEWKLGKKNIQLMRGFHSFYTTFAKKNPFYTTLVQPDDYQKSTLLFAPT
jgi:hypothetical protein